MASMASRPSVVFTTSSRRKLPLSIPVSFRSSKSISVNSSHLSVVRKTTGISKPTSLIVVAAAAVIPVEQRTGPDDLVRSILSKVSESDRGVTLTRDQHKEVDEISKELQSYCVDEPVKCPLIFGEWDVVYCSNPTSPGGGYRNAFGRLIFKAKEMIQVVESPDVVKNKVSFSAFGFLDGQVSLNGKLKVLDERWIQVIFEAPELKLGGLEFSYGGESEVKLEITYIDENIRLGKGSRGSLFVFQRLK
ncbi:probable plastid-lipid-associated protein 8, chloroplastic [Impatiens glandulifera]|uniref:probable plastid-lipid-associated protein 8, chloroplastic n=1 Tax=Impatiens glandulifera TaxID=253017 RepID=UPI001FB1698F|nr:probable plastid-lipid-associated protein 8, chloroplastic [Impatiens glandulifera]